MQHACVVLTGLIALCSLTGCAAKPAPPPPAPLLVPLPACPSPGKPRLAQLDGTLPFDAPANIQVLLERDDSMRGYVKGLEATVTCYQTQSTPPKAKEPQND